MSKGLTKRVREAAGGLGEFRSDDLINALHVQTYADAKRVRGVIRDLRKMGEIKGVSRGVYVYTPKQRPRTKLDIIWHLVRSNRHFSTDDMERLSGAARFTVLDYLHCLRKLGYIRQVRQGHWQMIKDPGPGRPREKAVMSNE